MNIQTYLERPYIQQAAWDEQLRKNIEYLMLHTTVEEQAEAILLSSTKIVNALENDELTLPDVYQKALEDYFLEQAETMTNEELG